MSHRDQEFFQIVVMNYRNFESYVQRQIDKMLRSFLDFVKIYINDVIVFFKSKKKHLLHLRQVFKIFEHNNISIKSFKSFLGYSFVRLLKQKVDSLKLATKKEKLRTINKLIFFRILRQLKHYFDFIDGMRKYVKNYSKIMKSLQNRKTTLFKNSSRFDNVKRFYLFKTSFLNPTKNERKTFNIIQQVFAKARYLIHYDSKRQLYINIDFSKESGMKNMIYHVKFTIKPDVDIKLSAYFERFMIESIMFFNKRITATKERYWLTKLKFADLMGILRKIRHMIKTALIPSIVFTNHGAIVKISQQINFSISFTDKLNLRLIKAFEYIQKFNLIIKHKSKKQHVVPNVLSKLKITNMNHTTLKNDELNALITIENVFYITSIIEISDEFRQQIIDGYIKDSTGTKIKKAIDVKNGITIFFMKEKNLIYKLENFTTDTNERHAYISRRLCLFDSVLKDVLRTVHEESHLRFHKCYENLTVIYCIKNLIEKFKIYLKHCSECQINQIRRHKAYESLQFIDILKVLFHTITIDFIMALSRSIQDFDIFMFTTCKFFKRMIFISRKMTWSAQNWANALLDGLNIMNGGLFKMIISDRDSKFLNEFGSTLFIKLNVRLFYSTIYHSQIDDQSERINQSIEIALRYHLIALNKSTIGPQMLSTIQKIFNNFICFIEFTSNEIVYGFIFNQIMNLSNTISNLAADIIRRQIIDVIVFSQISFKSNYDRKHHSIQIAIEDWALLRLHREYSIPFVILLEKKLFQQFVNSFKVFDKINRLIYKLKIPQNGRIHSMFIIAQLKSCPDFTTNLFARSQLNKPPSIHVKRNTNTIKSFVLEKIIDIKQSAKNKKYFVRGKDYDPKNDAGRNLSKMGNALNMIREYENANLQRVKDHGIFKKKSNFKSIFKKRSLSVKKRGRFKKT